MVTKEEIETVSKLMKIELDDHVIHIERVQKMINYFDILDNAGVEDSELTVQEMPISNLREDKHIPYEKSLIEYIKNYKEKYVKSPKMI